MTREIEKPTELECEVQTSAVAPANLDALGVDDSQTTVPADLPKKVEEQRAEITKNGVT